MKFKTIFKDASLTLLTQIVTALSGVIVMLLLSRKFGLGSYGDYYLIKRVSDVLWLFFLFGMTVSVPRNKAFLDKTRKEGSTEFSFLVFPVLSILFFCFLSEIFLTLFLKDSKEELGLIVFKLVIGMILYATITSYLRAISSFVILNINTFISFSLIPLVPFLFTYDSLSYLNLYTSLILVFNLITYIVISLNLLQKFSPFLRIKDKIEGFKELLKYGFFRLPGLFLASLIFTLPVTILNYLGTDEDIGSLGQVFQLFIIISMPINALGVILLPKLSTILSEGNDVSLKSFLKKGIKIIIIISAIIGLLLSISAEKVLYLINGEKIAFENFNMVRILILMIIPYSLYNFLRNPIDAAHATPFSTILVVFSFIGSAAVSLMIYNFSQISAFELVILFTGLNLLFLGAGSLIYTKKLYFGKGDLK